MTPEHALAVARELHLLCSSKTDVMFHGTSMEPLLREGDRVVVEPVDPRDIRPGDIITYRYLDRYPTRRVLSRRGKRLELRCDNWPDRTFNTTDDDVLGRVTARVREGDTLTVSDEAWRRIAAAALRRHRRREFPRRLRRVPARLGRAIARILGA